MAPGHFAGMVVSSLGGLRPAAAYPFAISKIDHDEPNDAYTDPRAWDVRVKSYDMKPTLAPILQRLEETNGLRRLVSLIEA